MKGKSDYIKVLDLILTHAQSKNYKSNDVSDLMKSKYYLYVKNLPNGIPRKILNGSYVRIAQYKPEWIRPFVKDKGYIYPQGQSIVVRSLVELAKKNHPLGDLKEAKKIADWLIENKSPHSKHFGWGQPFLWYSRKPFPVNIPRATVSSQVAWAFLDLFELTGDEQYLDIAKDVCYLFMEEFNYTPDKNGNFCISYTTIDHYHVHNASILAASVMMRVYKILGTSEIGDFAKKAIDFTVSHQNEDGSFYYWAPPDKLNYKIDNYHTGFVLESLRTIKDDCGDNSYDKPYRDGMEYYFSNLFDGPMPKITNERKYPIDIQSCAQSIITFYLDGESPEYSQKVKEIADYALESFFLEDNNHFAYRIYENGFKDKSYYFRWGDAWMLRALAYLI